MQQFESCSLGIAAQTKTDGNAAVHKRTDGAPYGVLSILSFQDPASASITDTQALSTVPAMDAQTALPEPEFSDTTIKASG